MSTSYESSAQHPSWRTAPLCLPLNSSFSVGLLADTNNIRKSSFPSSNGIDSVPSCINYLYFYGNSHPGRMLGVLWIPAFLVIRTIQTTFKIKYIRLHSSVNLVPFWGAHVVNRTVGAEGLRQRVSCRVSPTCLPPQPHSGNYHPATLQHTLKIIDYSIKHLELIYQSQTPYFL